MVFIAFPVALVLFAVSLICLIKSLLRKQVSLSDFFLGALFSIAVYSLIFVDYYYFTDVAYALGTGFVFPFYMVVIPAVLALVLRDKSQINMLLHSNVYFVAAVLSGIVLPLLSRYTFSLPEYLGIPVYH